MSLEALYLSKTGKAVLMVDAEQTFGGAWKTIEIAGIRDVENAVHYFLPNKKAIEFMKTKLNWPIEISKKRNIGIPKFLIPNILDFTMILCWDAWYIKF